MAAIGDTADWLGLRGKIVVVTGAAGGIGKVIVRSFVEVGAVVALIDRDETACEAVAEPLREAGATLASFACDIADEANVAAVALQVAAKLGPADVLVNNAAILNAGSLAEIEIAQWNKLLSVNLTGFLLCARSYGAQMKEKGVGAMVHVASIAGHMPQGYSGAYSVAKAGIRMLSQNLAIELGEFGIRSNVVSPAMLITPMSEAFYQDPVLKAKRVSMVPQRAIGTPQNIADAIIWFSSARADYVSGEELVVDGGLQRNLLTLIPRPGFDRQDHVENKSAK